MFEIESTLLVMLLHAVVERPATPALLTTDVWDLKATGPRLKVAVVLEFWAAVAKLLTDLERINLPDAWVAVAGEWVKYH